MQFSVVPYGDVYSLRKRQIFSIYKNFNVDKTKDLVFFPLMIQYLQYASNIANWLLFLGLTNTHLLSIIQ